MRCVCTVHTIKTTCREYNAGFFTFRWIIYYTLEFYVFSVSRCTHCTHCNLLYHSHYIGAFVDNICVPDFTKACNCATKFATAPHMSNTFEWTTTENCEKKTYILYTKMNEGWKKNMTKIWVLDKLHQYNGIGIFSLDKSYLRISFAEIKVGALLKRN